MSYMFMYGSAGDKRGNVLLVPEGCYVNVIMIQLLFYIAYLWQMSDFTLKQDSKLTE